MSTKSPAERIKLIDFERIEELAKQAGYRPVAASTVMGILANEQSNVMFVRFAYLIAAELSKVMAAELNDPSHESGPDDLIL